MKSIFNHDDRLTLATRLRRLTPAAAPRWGSMSAGQMAAHLADALRMAVGELLIPVRPTPLRLTPLKQLVIYAAPIPKGAPTAPELITRPPAPIATEIDDITGLLERCADASQTLADTHPLFGRMSRRLWGVLIHKHMDHHLRQFGV